MFLADVRERLSLVSLTSGEYARVIINSAAVGIRGGGIYDALLAHCALKVNAKALYTWNEKHFVRLGAEVSATVQRPQSTIR